MRPKTMIGVLLLFAGHASVLQGQLSPGELAEVHAHLEGIRNCTQCHSLGQKISEEKCLNCHIEIKQRINERAGYHVSREVEGKQCIACHSDHHGRNFEIVRFDQNGFDHALTGYRLEGIHKELECNECHRKEFIADLKIKQKDFTYLGLDNRCVNCHDDNHQGTLSTDCASCHGFESFTPAILFSHERTEFPLRGKHQKVDCKECHHSQTINGSVITKYKGIPFGSCADCHDDVHRGLFGVNCIECHTEISFQTIGGLESFNHNTTDFPLRGNHKTIDCTACHKNGTDNGGRFRQFAGLEEIQCALCHQDIHNSKFGPNCNECHTENSFLTGTEMVDFNHSLTDFPLEGKHQEVNCKNCHESNLLEPLSYQNCSDCHDDYHEGQFVTNEGNMQDCMDCHNVHGFSSTDYTIEKHNLSVFPLEGAHAATPCISCHFRNDQWEFRQLGSRCVDCHEDIHSGFLDTSLYPGQSCQNCHNSNAWNQITFDHNQTDFVLEGGHLSIKCSDCHFDQATNTIVQTFAGLTTACGDCHTDVHYSQFENNGKADCHSCHGFENWEPTNFDHNSAAFILEGAHTDVECKECHKEIQNNELRYVQYKFDRFQCVDCHL